MCESGAGNLLCKDFIEDLSEVCPEVLARFFCLQAGFACLLRDAKAGQPLAQLLSEQN